MDPSCLSFSLSYESHLLIVCSFVSAVFTEYGDNLAHGGEELFEYAPRYLHKEKRGSFKVSDDGETVIVTFTKEDAVVGYSTGPDDLDAYRGNDIREEISGKTSNLFSSIYF